MKRNLGFKARSAVFLVSKGTDADLIEDAVGFDESLGLFVVADGVTNSTLGALMARTIAASLSQAPFPASTEELSALRRWWQQQWAAGRDELIANGGTRRLERGPGASTFVSVAVGDMEGDSVRLRLAAVGDSCCFLVRGDRVHRSFPLAHAQEFSSTTNSVSSDPASPLDVRTAEWSDVGLNDWFLLASDALAQWVLGAPESVARLRTAIVERTARDLIRAELDAGRMNRDDVALLAVWFTSPGDPAFERRNRGAVQGGNPLRHLLEGRGAAPVPGAVAPYASPSPIPPYVPSPAEAPPGPVSSLPRVPEQGVANAAAAESRAHSKAARPLSEPIPAPEPGETPSTAVGESTERAATPQPSRAPSAPSTASAPPRRAGQPAAGIQTQFSRALPSLLPLVLLLPPVAFVAGALVGWALRQPPDGSCALQLEECEADAEAYKVLADQAGQLERELVTTKGELADWRGQAQKSHTTIEELVQQSSVQRGELEDVRKRYGQCATNLEAAEGDVGVAADIATECSRSRSAITQWYAEGCRDACPDVAEECARLLSDVKLLLDTR